MELNDEKGNASTQEDANRQAERRQRGEDPRTGKRHDEGVQVSGPFTDALKVMEHFDRLPMKYAMARMEASKFIGEDGKECFRLRLARPAALSQADGYAESYPNGCPILPEGDA